MNKTTIIASLLLMGIVATYRIDALREQKDQWAAAIRHSAAQALHLSDTPGPYQYAIRKTRIIREQRKEINTCRCQLYIYGVPSSRNRLLCP